ncbi:hypothetical protein I7I51_07225 [Histoplasma capsulatum]|uniref:Methyltransferase n=1 Tax=Ajellomyces capsulatus TaxID=5037 RepID=A0A8A1MIB7_AJECA|nr:hypothetical protein I7I51_07225 [Histoplasma capsulatum]
MSSVTPGICGSSLFATVTDYIATDLLPREPHGLSKASTILDIGCGGGQIVTEILKKYIAQSCPKMCGPFVRFCGGHGESASLLIPEKAAWERLETAALDGCHGPVESLRTTNAATFSQGFCV